MTRTERDLRWLADNICAKRIVRGIPERLEALAAWHRNVQEAEKAANGEPNDHDIAQHAYFLATARLRDAGVGVPTGELTLSPCCGPDLPRP